jgi:hypothetical protein
MNTAKSQPFASTRDLDEAQAVLSRELVNLRIKKVSNTGRFCMDMNGVHLGRTALAYNWFEVETQLVADIVEDAMFLIIGAGRGCIHRQQSD